MSKRYKVGIVGLGAIGLQIARTIDQGNVSNFDLVAIATRDEKKAAKNLETFAHIPDITSIKNVCATADIIVECAPATIFRTIIEETVEAGKTLIPASVGALLPYPDIIERAKSTGAKIIVPTGALIGLDAVRAAAEGRIEKITLKTRCLLYTSPSPRDRTRSRMPSSA